MLGRAAPFSIGLSALLAISLAVFGCGKKSEQSAAGGSTPGGGTLIVGTEADADALNPAISSTADASDIYGNLFIYLCKSTPDMEDYEPWGAKSWEFSDDRKTLTFHLRDDIYWHDGVKMTAYDVEYSFYIHKNPEVAWATIRWLDNIESVTAVDSFTVVTKFSKVYPYQLTDANVYRPIPKHLLEHVPPAEMKNAEFNRNPVGNGPFKFKKWVAQQYIEIVANDDYFLGRPKLDKVIFKVVPDRTSLLTQIETGEIDLYHKFPPEAYERLSRNPDLRIYKFPSRSYYYVGWNNADPLFSNRNVRRALNMAINRQEIIDVLCYGLAKPVYGPFLSWLWAYSPSIKPLPFAPAEAKRVLAQEGWADHDGDGWLDKDGRRFEFELVTNENNQLRKDIAVMVQNKLEKIGIKVKPRSMEWTTFVSEMQQKHFQASVSGWIVSIKADLTSHWHSKSIDDKFNYISYSNPRVDQLIDGASMELDRTKAKAMWAEAQQIIADDAPYFFLFNLDDLNVLHKRFKNVNMVTYGWDYNLPDWYVPANEIKYKD
jgi:peptide/nickel transport system substrate-binding protein